MKKYIFCISLLIFSLTSFSQSIRTWQGFDPITNLPGYIYRDTAITVPYTPGKYLTGYKTFGSFPDSARAAFTGTTNLITITAGVINVGSSVVTLTLAQTLTNKRITQRVTTIASSGTPTPDADASDMFTVTALAAGATFAAPTGTPTDGQLLLIRIKDNGTARTLGWNAIYRASTDFTLPVTTVISLTMYVQFVYNSADSKWDATGLTQGF